MRNNRCVKDTCNKTTELRQSSKILASVLQEESNFNFLVQGTKRYTTQPRYAGRHTLQPGTVKCTALYVYNLIYLPVIDILSQLGS